MPSGSLSPDCEPSLIAPRKRAYALSTLSFTIITSKWPDWIANDMTHAVTGVNRKHLISKFVGQGRGMCISIGRTYRGVFHLRFGLGETFDNRCFVLGAAFAKTVPEGRETRRGDENEKAVEA